MTELHVRGPRPERGVDRRCAESDTKTGSAEVGGQERPDSWFTAYRGDVAAAAVVPEGDHGNEAAGPVMSAALAAG
ncbi:hypothetical protein [Streptomyces sp. B8F3]|uniref:hypothetical protein n=1 Tax=unclassified Streptomyces TaxID=2593676 RepID=UPI00325E261F